MFGPLREADFDVRFHTELDGPTCQDAFSYWHVYGTLSTKASVM